MKKKYKVALTYFKPRGRYYSGGSYETTCENPYEIFVEVREMLQQGKRPGLIDGTNEFFTLVNLPDHKDGFPFLIAPDNVVVIEPIGNAKILEKMRKYPQLAGF